MSKIAFAFLVACCLQDGPKKIMIFSTPNGADPKTLQICAKQLKRRIVDFGYKGVWVDAYEGSVKVSFDPGFTPIMMLTINRLALCRGQAFLWADMPLTDKEREQWIPGKTSPPGTSWLIEEGQQWIMDDSWKFQMDVRFERYQVDGGIEMPRLAFSKSDTKKFMDRIAAEKIQRQFKIMLDDRRMPHTGNLSVREQWDRSRNEKISTGILDWKPAGQVTDELLINMICIGSPLPLQLSN